MSKAMRVAWELAMGLSAEAVSAAKPDGRRREKFLVLGDPQARLDTLLAALDRQQVLGEDGRLKSEIGLISMGDHFDFRLESEAPALVTQGQRDGLAFLRWLAHHPQDQVFILGGNHDFSRVMELAHETEESWTRARALAVSYGKKPTQEQRAEFIGEFPHIPTPGIARGDYAMFSVAQRDLIQTLLLSKRMKLALTARMSGGMDVLVTHAGVTRRELKLLGVGEGDGPAPTARALSTLLEQAVEAVAEGWRAGKAESLSLAPVNVSGVSWQEGGGLLNHRPAHPEWPGQTKEWAWREASPRRFDPRNLPTGLVQVAGHTGHTMSRKELHSWAAETAVGAASVRTLQVAAQECVYRAGVQDHVQGAATMYLVDPEFWCTPAEALEFMWLEAVVAPS